MLVVKVDYEFCPNGYTIFILFEYRSKGNYNYCRTKVFPIKQGLLFFYFQYITITRKNSFALGSNDRFFNYYFNCCIAFVSSAIATVNNITPGKFDMNYYMCTGENPSKYDFLGKKASNPLSCHTQNIQNIFFFKHHVFLLIKVTDYGHPERAFFQKLETFGLGQTNRAEIL